MKQEKNLKLRLTQQTKNLFEFEKILNNQFQRIGFTTQTPQLQKKNVIEDKNQKKKN